MKISKRLNWFLPAYGIVSYRNIPLYRCQAWALDEVLEHDVVPRIISGIRNDNVIAAHNRQFHTNLHGQQFLINLNKAGKGNPANPVNQTSHCGFADGNPFYGPRGTKILKLKNGIDFLDNATATRVVNTLNAIGIPAKQPYDSGSERHHGGIGRTGMTKKQANVLIGELRSRRRRLEHKRNKAKR